MARLSRPAWLDEHLGQSSYPDRATIANVLPHGWEIAEECGSGNVAALLALSVAESLRVGQRLTSRVSDRYSRRGIPTWWDSGWTYRTFFVLAPIGAVR